MKTFSIGRRGVEKKEYVQCPLCGGRNYALWPDRDVPFVFCRNCRVVYQNPRPTISDIAARYDEDYFVYEKENEENFLNLILLGLKDIEFNLVQKRLLNELGPAAGFLDIGCATGTLLEYMKAQGWQEMGVEVCWPAVRYGREIRGVSVFHGTLEEAHFAPAQFAVAHASHVIEHLPRPTDFVAELYRVICPGGYLIIATPNFESMQAYLYRGRWRSAIADHMVLFSKKRLNSFVTSYGFEHARSVTWGGLPAGSCPRRIKRFFDIMAKKWGLGDVVLSLFQKK